MRVSVKVVFVSIILLFMTNTVLPKSKFINIYIKSHKFLAEIADTPELTAKGLMYRRSIPDDYAMLFIFEDELERGFWMKNTLIPLDIIFLNKDKEIINIHHNVQPCRKSPCKTYYSLKPSKYVVEINGKLSRKFKLKSGDRIEFLY